LNRLFQATVVENRQIIKNHYLLTLHPLEKIKKPKPGNFFMLSVDSGLDPLLKRPFSVHRWLGGDFQLLYRIVGQGTAVLSKKKPDNRLDVIGPLGNGFSIKKSAATSILVAGGLGIAPIFALAESMYKKSPLLFYGARTKKEVLCLDELQSLGINPTVSTDDGTHGKKGNIITTLKNYLSRSSSPVTQTILYACGPEPMLRSLSLFAQKNKLKGYAALEQNMACGIGTCLGCVVQTVHGYKRVCKEGPVFPIEEILW
jgi:dihydroorotate dehydrogenase electron transfer subunit